MTPRCAALLLIVALTGCDDVETVEFGKPVDKPVVVAASEAEAPQPFDFYVLALSWSPSYCKAEGAEANRQQCNSRRDYAFIVHGLWPQFERGFPTDCPTEKPRVPDELVRSLYDLMPSAGLIGYQWRRHGGCSGLSQEDYFATLRSAREAVDIPVQYQRPSGETDVDPDAVEQAFLASNPGLPSDAISISCDDNYLREVRICMTKQLAFRACPALEKRSCRAKQIAMPPVSGG